MRIQKLLIIFMISALLLSACGGSGKAAETEKPDAGVTETSPETARENASNSSETILETAAETSSAVSPETSPEAAAETSTAVSPETSQEAAAQTSSEISPEASSDVPVVYFTADISAEGLAAAYAALGVFPAESDQVAVKLHTGAGEDSYYLREELIGDFIRSLDATIVECNTALGGRRSNTAYHYQIAEDHGFTAIAPVVILDEYGSFELPVSEGKHLKSNLVGGHFPEYDFYVVLSHFKGHMMGGFGGALKNMSIGFASQQGKNRIHRAGESDEAWFPTHGAAQDDFLESMAEAGKAVADYCGEDIIYINVMNNLSVDCDCLPMPREPSMADIGILASTDPVALDQACVDLVYAAPDGRDIIAGIEALHGQHALDYGEEIGLGSKTYRMVNIDD